MVMGMIGFDMALSVLFTDIIQNNLVCFNGFFRKKLDTPKEAIIQFKQSGKKFENWFILLTTWFFWAVVVQCAA